MVNDELRGIVTRMVEGGESEQDIAAVIQRYKTTRQPAPEPAEEKSVGGFLSNIASSGGKFIGDTAGALTSPVETAKNLWRLGLGAAEKLIPGEQGHEQYADAVGQHFKDRYGGVSNIGETLYNDPVGALADVSTVLGGGAGLAKIGSLSKIPGAARAAGTLRRAEQATNPMRAVTAPAGAALREAGIGAVRGTVRPPASVRNDFGGSREIAKTIVDERLTSANSANAKTTAAREAVDAALAQAEQAGVQGPRSSRIVRGLRRAGSTSADDVKLGAGDTTPELVSRAQNIRKASGGKPIPLTEAQRLKRRAQDRAFEARGQGLTTKAQGEEGIATALREGIEEAVPEVGPMNQRTQRLLGATKSLEAASDRPKGLTNILSAGAGGALGLGGDPMSALAAFLAMQAADSPRFGTALGIGSNELSKILRSKILQEMALAGRAGAIADK